MSDFIVVSFGTTVPPVFERCAERLQANLLELNLPCEVDVIKPITQNEQRKHATLYKPEFALEKFYKHKKTIILLDADTKVLSADLLPPGDYDVGIMRNSKAGKFSKLPYIDFIQVIKYNQGGWNYLNMWHKYCLENWSWHDHKRQMWAIHTANARFKDVSTFFNGKLIKNGFAEGSDYRDTVYYAKDEGDNFLRC